MNLKPRVKVIVGLATLWPLMWGMALVLLAFVREVFFGEDDFPTWLAGIGAVTYLVLAWSVLLVPFLVVFYLVYVFRMPGMTSAAKGLWAVAILAGSVIVMPVFFYRYVWRHSPAGPPTGR
jgi:hypothetical protein